MFDDDIRDGLFELAEHAPLNGDLEGIRSAGIRKRRVRQAGIATAGTLAFLALGISVSSMRGSPVNQVTTDIADEVNISVLEEPAEDEELVTTTSTGGTSTSDATATTVDSNNTSVPDGETGPEPTSSLGDDGEIDGEIEGENQAAGSASATVTSTPASTETSTEPDGSSTTATTTTTTTSSSATSSTTTTPPESTSACEVYGNGSISWTDHEQSLYWVYRSSDGGDTYEWIGRTYGETTFIDLDYRPEYLYKLDYQGLWPRVDCRDTTSFACQVNSSGAVTWTDQRQSVYSVYRSDDGGAVSRLVTSSATGLAFIDGDYQAGSRYEVGYEGLAKRADCLVVAGFSCSVTAAGRLSWPDLDEPAYWIYRSIDGGTTYSFAGKTLGATSFTDPDYELGYRYRLDHKALLRRPDCVQSP